MGVKMTRVNLNWLPKKCAYCKNPVDCEITKHSFLRRTSVHVCEDCANEIWEEETNRRLP